MPSFSRSAIRVAWTFNIRGSDIPHTPVALAFAIVPVTGKPELFIAPEKLEPAVRAHLETFAKISAPEALAAAAESAARGRQARAARSQHRQLLACPRARRRQAHRARARSVAGAEGHARTLPRSKAHALHTCATASPLRVSSPGSTRAAADGRARRDRGGAPLEGFRRATSQLREICFDTISGSGPNGAIVHYRVDEATNRKLRAGELFLIDSGAQYLDGTTDITRTVAIGKPTNEMRERFTLVLKGHIAIASAGSPRARAASISTPSRAARCGSTASTTITAPATASAAISPCTRGRSRSRSAGMAVAGARHDLLQRARLLQGGRLRHPHRESRPRHRADESAAAPTARSWASRR